MDRALEAELLDSLPATDPEARRSRRDLRVVNAVMGNERWLRRQLQRWVNPGEAVLEIGAGEGRLRKAAGAGLNYAGLDLGPRPDDWPPEAAWHQVDVREFRGWSAYPVICGNLFFHHFSDAELAELGQRLVRSARVVLASEPARGTGWQKLFATMCRLLGAGKVTRHDGHVSIAAGFAGDELPQWLGLDPHRGWCCTAHRGGVGAYRLVAIRS
ncbi:MAG TPA: hypothetical protein VG734_24140 [Lacunisphaera sp.]|nr:hypothetical protein [Lacunisphaera sp.]